jgi:hypothetical protein
VELVINSMRAILPLQIVTLHCFICKMRLAHCNELLAGAVLGKSILFYVGISIERHDTRKAAATLLETNG